MKRLATRRRAKPQAERRSNAVNANYRGGATPAVREYLGGMRDAEIRASRGGGSRVPERSRRERAPRSPRPPAAPSADRARDTRRQSLRALENNISRAQSTRAQSTRAQSARAQSTRAQSARAQSARTRATGSTGPFGGGRAVASAGGAAALTVGRTMAEVARPAAAAAKPVLRVVTGGLDRIPAPGARAAARGRILIVIAGLLAAGLIYISVGKLEAGDGYSRYAQRSLELQRENTIIRSKVAALESSERIARRAKKLGMVMPQPEQFKYLRTRGGDSTRAIRTYTAPQPAPTPPPATAPVAQPTTPAPDVGATSPAQPAPQPVAPQTSPQPAPGAAPAVPGAGTGAPAVGGD